MWLQRLTAAHIFWRQLSSRVAAQEGWLGWLVDKLFGDGFERRETVQALHKCMLLARGAPRVSLVTEWKRSRAAEQGNLVLEHRPLLPYPTHCPKPRSRSLATKLPGSKVLLHCLDFSFPVSHSRYRCSRHSATLCKHTPVRAYKSYQPHRQIG